MFVLIIGPPRTGTSLMVDLIRTCGYNFGDVTKPKHSRPNMGKRSPRNEHNATMRGKLPKNPLNKVKKFKQSGITANKIVNSFHKWLPHFHQVFGPSLRIIIMRRDPATGLRSVSEIAESWTEEKQKEFWTNRRKWAEEIAQSDEYSTLVVDFEDLINKNEDVLGAIVKFVDGKASVDDLKKQIKPGVSKHK